MLGNLIKYELKACGRVFIPIYIAILIIASANGIFMNTEIFQVQGVLTIVLVSLFVALFVLTIILTVQRFRKNLLEDEGYLMFTLPVSINSLIFSKYIVSLIYAVFSTIVAVLSFGLMLVFTGEFSFGIFSESWRMLSKLLFEQDLIQFIIFVTLSIFVAYTMFILNIYLSISMGQLPIFNKYRNMVGFISFFIINTIISSARYNIANQLQKTQLYSDSIVNISGYSPIYIVIDIIVVAILFTGTSWILNKKLNLE